MHAALTRWGCQSQEHGVLCLLRLDSGNAEMGNNSDFNALGDDVLREIFKAAAVAVVGTIRRRRVEKSLVKKLSVLVGQLSSVSKLFKHNVQEEPHFFPKHIRESVQTCQPNCVFLYACTEGHLDVVKWLCRVFGLTAAYVRGLDNWALRKACEHGHLEVARWLHTTFNLVQEDARACHSQALCLACSNGHLELAQWLHTAFSLRGRCEGK